MLVSAPPLVKIWRTLPVPNKIKSSLPLNPSLRFGPLYILSGQTRVLIPSNRFCNFTVAGLHTGSVGMLCAKVVELSSGSSSGGNVKAIRGPEATDYIPPSQGDEGSVSGAGGGGADKMPKHYTVLFQSLRVTFRGDLLRLWSPRR